MSPLILVTRPIDGAAALAEDIHAEIGPDAEICISPLLQIEHIAELPDLSGYPTLVFTSAHAVDSFAAATSRRDFVCLTVGSATADTARQHGFEPVEGPGAGSALAQEILAHPPKTPCLYLRGDHVAFDVAAALNAGGIVTYSAIVYRQVERPLTEEALNRIKTASCIIAPVLSARSARLLLAALPSDTALRVAAISDAVADCFHPDRVERIEIAQRPEKKALAHCVATLWNDAIQLEGNCHPQ